MNTCYFTGYNNPAKHIRPTLANAIEQHIAIYSVTTFLFGCYGVFIRMAKVAAPGFPVS